MPADPPDLGFAFLLVMTRAALAAAQQLAERRGGDVTLAATVTDLSAAVARLEKHPDAAKSEG